MSTSSLVKTFEFEGHALSFSERSGEWWAAGEDVAEALGYSSRKQVLKVFERHSAEFLPSETATVDLTATDGKVYQTRVFSLRGLEHLAILGRTETCVRFRRWILDVIERLRSGEVRLVTVEKLDQVLAAKDAHIAALEKRLDSQDQQSLRQAGFNDTVAGFAGSLLRYIRFNPLTKEEELQRALDREKRERAEGQHFLTPPPVNGAVNRLPEN